MTVPRFYQVELRTTTGDRRCLALDLLNVRAPTDATAIVREIASSLRALDPGRHARTSYVGAPDADAELQPMWAYAWGDGSPNMPRLRRHLDAIGSDQSVHRFVIRAGAWAEGADLVGRGGLLDSLSARLCAGGHLHLMAPRRYGKTSLVRAVEERLSRDGRFVVRIDVEGIDNLPAFAVRLVDEALLVGDALRVVDELRHWPDRDASAVVRAEACSTLSERIRSGAVGFLERVCGAMAKADAILLADEFSRFVLETMPHEQRSAFLRALGAVVGTPGLAVMVCGSQGLRGFVDWHDLRPLRELESVTVGPLEHDVAAILVEELFYGAGHSPVPDAVGAVLEAVGAPIPFFLHGLVHHTLQEHRTHGSSQARAPIQRQTVERAYERRLLDQEGNEFFRSFRLKERGYPDPLRAPAATILRLLSRSTASLGLEALRASCGLPEEDFELLLAALVEDYDVVRDADGARFRSKVMRERWARREAWVRGGAE